MTSDIQDIIRMAMYRGCDYCDLIALMLDDATTCDFCPFNMENADKCVLTNIADAVI